MSEKRIIPIVMPKWGLSMEEGKVTSWLMKDGDQVKVGDQILEVETDKIAGAVEASDAGILRRRIGQADTIYPIKTLIGVVADADVPDSDIDEFVSSYVVPAAEEGEDETGPRYEFIDTGVGRLRYIKRGTADNIVLLIHGFGGDLDNWLFNADAFAEKASVYALDLPGHGQSTKTLGDPTVAGLARAVLGFMDAVKIDKAHLVGHSLGGAISLRLAIRRPELVSALVLAGAAGISSGTRRARYGLAMTALLKPGKRIAPYRRRVARSAALKTLVFGHWGAADPPALPADVAESFLSGPARHTDTASAARALVHDDPRLDLEHVRCPVLLLWGARDNQLSIGDAFEYARRLRAPVRAIADCGHLLIGERPEACADAIGAFLHRHGV